MPPFCFAGCRRNTAMSLRLISFDAVGTLIHVRHPVAETYAQIAAQHGIEAGEFALGEAFRTAWKSLPVPLHPSGAPPADDDRSWWLALVSQVFAGALGTTLPEQVLTPLFNELYAHYEMPAAWTVYEDVLPTLQDLARDHVLCVLSNFDRRLRTILAGHRLSPFFRTIIVSSEVGASKPHSRMFAAALEVVGGSPGQCLHIGDEVAADVNGAEAAGWNAFLIHRPESGLNEVVGKVRSGAYSGLRAA